jgi:hypothetical protein
VPVDFSFSPRRRSDEGGSAFQFFQTLTLPEFRRTLAAWQNIASTIGFDSYIGFTLMPFWRLKDGCSMDLAGYEREESKFTC